jgi:hypothetical protein
MSRNLWLAGIGCVLLLHSRGVMASWRAGNGGGAGAWVQLVQERGIHGQNPETAGRGEGPTGYVQAPLPRGHNAPEQAAQGAGAAKIGASGTAANNKQRPAGQNPGTPVTTPLPGPSGLAPETSSK